MILQDQQQRSIQMATPMGYSGQSAMAASTHNGSSSSFNTHQQNQSKGNKPFYHCDFCGRDGHSISRCRMKPGNANYDPNFQPFSRSSQQKQHKGNSFGHKYNQHVAAAVEQSTPRPSSNELPFTHEQIQQLLTLIQSSPLNTSTPFVNFAGPDDEESDRFG
ncbi:uncharacterized protein LOC126654563 [Mercurialis annua]|uniref:uncharacterized protein LOC126654563 n=1 Tax=Mercurialis annua TaxID=3986 RepID=UPI00215F0155|nr:uncharacterized protein LOC126654563 [Mercurialis annua]